MAYIASIRINQVISSDLVPGTDVEWLRFEQSHLHHSAIRRASQQFLTAFYQEFGELAQTSPSRLRWSILFGSLAVHDGHPFNHPGECVCVPATCDVPTPAPTAGATRRGRVRRAPRQRSAICRLGAPRTR